MKKHFEIISNAEGEFHDRGSKFIARLVKVHSEKEATEMMQEMRKMHPKANHLCFAYRVLDQKTIIENLSDDGEPTHSAGQPILRQLQAEDLVNSLAMVIRYFGGVKLGVGGLMKAYKNATQEALKNISKIEIKESEKITLITSYGLYGDVMAILDKEGLDFKIENGNENAIIELKVDKEKAEEVRELFAHLSVQFV